MAVVELLLPALPAHVRTARLVCVAVARRAGLSDALVDELRLAVGEACARAVGLHARHAPDVRVAVTITDDFRGLTVAVRDHGPAAGPAVDDMTGGLLDAGPLQDEDVDPDVSLALLGDLVGEVEVSPGAASPGGASGTASPGGASGAASPGGASGTTVTMRWPLAARIGASATAASP